MRKGASFSTTWISLLPVVFLLASASVGFAKTQKKSTASNQETPSALLLAAMKNMTTGVWSVNGTVSLEKTIKLHGLLSGEDYDLTMEPRGMRGIAIKKGLGLFRSRDVARRQPGRSVALRLDAYTDHGRPGRRAAV